MVLSASISSSPPALLLGWQCGALKTVTRSTFTSELMSAISSTDHGLAVAITLGEVWNGPKGSDAGRRQRDTDLPMDVYIELFLKLVVLLEVMHL